jgi:geranyl diphosphate synthase
LALHLLQGWGGGGFAPIDPFALVADEIESVSQRLRQTVMTDIPALSRAAEYFFKLGAEGKRLRPTILLLMASSLSAVVPSPSFLAVDVRPPNIHPTGGGSGRHPAHCFQQPDADSFVQ